MRDLTLLRHLERLLVLLVVRGYVLFGRLEALRHAYEQGVADLLEADVVEHLTLGQPLVCELLEVAVFVTLEELDLELVEPGDRVFVVHGDAERGRLLGELRPLDEEGDLLVLYLLVFGGADCCELATLIDDRLLALGDQEIELASLDCVGANDRDSVGRH